MNLEKMSANDVYTVTPADGSDLAKMVWALFITTGGTLKIDTFATDAVTITVPDNFMLNCKVTRVYSTGTSATGIIGFA
jgi:hypothetical protein